ncbi:hypothetical protein JMJ77_0013613 [Colletotrichum scovillei]|uniref:Uncharacterized protein n=1 Tax=Colletotrichum scovillei TaxID=1209932 RepID=A0A9P7U3E8_9PEZI|nr:hypothetical protein JMJ78_0012941 [Colletotrichum scovillei]KAG7040616.1 hypothetical protein JMJ77_0013613 [Colletotrichum scovillei]KAG7060663.1 hypothetical protein JMJ76_0006206 [Colletotrichum scovillei]
MTDNEKLVLVYGQYQARVMKLVAQQDEICRQKMPYTRHTQVNDFVSGPIKSQRRRDQPTKINTRN